MTNIEMYLMAAESLLNRNGGNIPITRKDIAKELGNVFINRMGNLGRNHKHKTTAINHACAVLGSAITNYIDQGGTRLRVVKKNGICYYLPGVVKAKLQHVNEYRADEFIEITRLLNKYSNNFTFVCITTHPDNCHIVLRYEADANCKRLSFKEQKENLSTLFYYKNNENKDMFSFLMKRLEAIY